MYVVTHKQVDIPEIAGYKPIVVGKNEVSYSDFVRDNTGDNIAEKNPNYCELTALYWMWKNDQKSDLVGLSHYRRFFSTNISNARKEVCLQWREAEKILKSYDVILPYPKTWFDCSVKQWFLETDGKKKDIDALREVVAGLAPDYIDSYDFIMDGPWASYFNMFVMPKEMMNRYCEWLFKILFELEKRIDISNYTPLEARIYGFLSERLLNIWMHKNKYRIKYLPVFQVEKKQSYKMMVKDVLKYNVSTKKILSIFKLGSWGNLHK